jgi:thiamine-monophosphate kinase
MSREEDIIRSFFQRDDSSPDDDCALLEDGLLLTTDSMSEGFHFQRGWSGPADLAVKLFQTNLSDISASGGDPVWALLNIGIPLSLSDDEIHIFAAALNDELEAYGVKLAGGDTYASDRLQLNLTLGGKVIRYLPRSGGMVGDSIYLTGSIGLSMTGFLYLSGKIEDSAIESAHSNENEINMDQLIKDSLDRHLRPRARYNESKALRDNRAVHGAMDLSDGIFQDLPRMAKASNLALEIDLDRIPIHPGLETIVNRETLLESGEEYELLFMGKPGLNFPFPCTEIGSATGAAMNGSVTWKQKGRTVRPLREGFDHFKKDLYGNS